MASSGRALTNPLDLVVEPNSTATLGPFPAAAGDCSAFGARRFDHMGSEGAYSWSDYRNGVTAMPARMTLFASTLGLAAAMASQAKADVIYTVFNTANGFTLFVYDAPAFITTDTTVSGAQLAYEGHPITDVDFILSSTTFPGNSEVDVVFDPSAGMAEQFRYYPDGAFAQFGVYPPSNPASANYPTSELSVAAPEPSTIVLLGAALFGMLGLRRGVGKKV